MAHIDDLTAYITDRGENPVEIDAALVETALEYGYFHSQTRLDGYATLPGIFQTACYGVYKQLKTGGAGGAYTGFDVQGGAYQFKGENDIPYNSRRIFESFRPNWSF